MKKQVILNFLNFPGIVGLGLMDGHSRPYFSGIDQSLNFQQKEALTQGIQQVISTIPPGFEAFDFRFAQGDVRIYKLNNGVILLVLTDEILDASGYEIAIRQLKETLESDAHSAVSTFRLLAGSTTPGRLSEGEPAPDPLPLESLRAPLSSLPTDTSPAPGSSPHTWDQGVAALNALTDATAQYLGKIVVANTWRSTHPAAETLACLHIDRNGQFSVSLADTADRQLLGPADLEALHQWVQKFTQRCTVVIRDYPEMVLAQAVLDPHRAVLGLPNAA